MEILKPEVNPDLGYYDWHQGGLFSEGRSGYI